jgi:hypothetical protein
MPTEYNDERLDERGFRERFGRYDAASLWGAQWIGSALTKREYIYFDFDTGRYVVEPRYRY